MYIYTLINDHPLLLLLVDGYLRNSIHSIVVILCKYHYNYYYCLFILIITIRVVLAVIN